MALYVVTVPDPPAGFDWQTMVPGQYFYDVTGITATLATGTGPTTVAHDASGNGNDALYNPVATPADFVAGALTGDAALTCGAAGVQVGNWIDYTGDWTLTYWFRFPTVGVPNIPWLATYGFNGGFGSRQIFNADLQFGNAGDPSSIQTLSQIFPFDPRYQSAYGGYPDDGNYHLMGFEYHVGTGVCDLYVDGALVVPALFANPAALPLLPYDFTTLGLGLTFGPPQGIGEYDEFAAFNHTIGPAGHAALFAAAPNFAAYTAAVLGFGPICYYHLDDAAIPSTGRQPSLIVGDGTSEVLAIPSGFPATVLPGPYRYTWQPALNADQQSTDGTITTVAIPQLRIPAGYTVGVRTLDIQPTDQWSNVALWWDDAYMQSLPEFNPYVYPPGANLRYASSGA